MLKDFQKAFRISDEDLAQLRNGEFSAKVQKKMSGSADVLLGIGIICSLVGLGLFLNGSFLFFILFLFGLVIIYSGYTNRRGVSAGKRITMTSKFEFMPTTDGGRKLKLDDGKTIFHARTRTTDILEEDTEYIVYFVEGGKQLIMIEPTQ